MDFFVSYLPNIYYYIFVDYFSLLGKICFKRSFRNLTIININESDISNSISSEVILNKFATSEHKKKIIIGILTCINVFYTNKITINVNYYSLL